MVKYCNTSRLIIEPVLASISVLFFLTPAGLPRLWAAIVNYHAGLYPETAEPLVAASGLHTQKPRCSTTAITAAGTTTAALHPQRWVCSPEYSPRYLTVKGVQVGLDCLGLAWGLNQGNQVQVRWLGDTQIIHRYIDIYSSGYIYIWPSVPKRH